MALRTLVGAPTSCSRVGRAIKFIVAANRVTILLMNSRPHSSLATLRPAVAGPFVVISRLLFSLTLLETNRKTTSIAEVPDIVVSVLVLSCRLTTTALVMVQNRAVITSRTTGSVHCRSVGCIVLASREPLLPI